MVAFLLFAVLAVTGFDAAHLHHHLADSDCHTHEGDGDAECDLCALFHSGAYAELQAAVDDGAVAPVVLSEALPPATRPGTWHEITRHSRAPPVTA